MPTPWLTLVEARNCRSQTVRQAHSVGTLFGMAGCAGTIGTIIVQSLIGRFIDLQLYILVFWLIGTLPLAAALLMLTVPIRKLRHPSASGSGEESAG